MLLIPQKVGHLLLPSLDIRRNTPDETNNSLPQAKRVETTFEVDYKGRGKNVLVIPNLRETTTALEAEAMVGKSSLVDSQRRIAVD